MPRIPVQSAGQGVGSLWVEVDPASGAGRLYILTSVAPDAYEEIGHFSSSESGLAVVTSGQGSDVVPAPTGTVVGTTDTQTLTNKSLTAPKGVVCGVEVTFTETAGAGTYTGSVSVPAGATLVNIIVQAVAVWDNTGAVTMKVGDTDDDGFYVGINLKATDLTIGQTISFAKTGGKEGAYFSGTATHIDGLYSASARTISGIITTASTGGSAGRTRMTVLYHLPVTANIVTATKA